MSRYILRNYDTSFSVLSKGVEGEKPYFRSKREAMEHGRIKLI